MMSQFESLPGGSYKLDITNKTIRPKEESDDIPDDVCEKRREELRDALRYIRNDVEKALSGDVALFPQGKECPRQVERWFHSNATTKAFGVFLRKEFQVNGEEGDWCNGWMGSRWSDTTINGHRVRIAYYSRKTDAKQFIKLPKMFNGKNHLLMIMWNYFEPADAFVDALPPFTCCICKRQEIGFGNNPLPVSRHGICCEKCNFEVVLPRRIADYQMDEERQQQRKMRKEKHKTPEERELEERKFQERERKRLEERERLSNEYVPRVARSDDEIAALFAAEELSSKGLTKEQKRKEAERIKAIETRRANAEAKAEQKRKEQFIKQVSKKEALKQKIQGK